MTINEIKIYMKNNRITYQELSDKSQIPVNTLKKIFSGRTENPRIDTMRAIEEALGISRDKSLADTIVDRVDELNIEDYSNLSEEDRRKIAEVFNLTVSAFKKK